MCKYTQQLRVLHRTSKVIFFLISLAIYAPKYTAKGTSGTDDTVQAANFEGPNTCARKILRIFFCFGCLATKYLSLKGHKHSISSKLEQIYQHLYPLIPWDRRVRDEIWIVLGRASRITRILGLSRLPTYIMTVIYVRYSRFQNITVATRFLRWIAS